MFKVCVVLYIDITGMLCDISTVLKIYLLTENFQTRNGVAQVICRIAACINIQMLTETTRAFVDREYRKLCHLLTTNNCQRSDA